MADDQGAPSVSDGNELSGRNGRRDEGARKWREGRRQHEVGWSRVSVGWERNWEYECKGKVTTTSRPR